MGPGGMTQDMAPGASAPRLQETCPASLYDRVYWVGFETEERSTHPTRLRLAGGSGFPDDAGRGTVMGLEVDALGVGGVCSDAAAASDVVLVVTAVSAVIELF